MLVLGVDENGLGPVLGPLVATSVTLEMPRYERSALRARGLSLGLTDSKEAGGFGQMQFAESVALALLWGCHGAGPPGSADAVLDRVFADGRARLRACCPDDPTAAQCWAVDLPLPIFGGDPDVGWEAIERLVGRSSLRIVDVRSRVACAGVLNAARAAGKHKFDVDFDLFEDLIASVHLVHGAPLLAICGMIGGIRDYAPRFSRFDRSRVEHVPGRRGQRRYAVDGVGEIRFEIDADMRHLPVSLASIVGKYVREICMRRIGEFYRRRDPELALASGYRDPVTKRFFEGTALLRKQIGIAQECFRRES
jgi:ribonuclease HII